MLTPREIICLARLLHSKELHEVAQESNIPVRTLCHNLKSYQLSKQGLFNDSLQYNETLNSLIAELCKEFANIQEISEEFKITRQRFSSMCASAKVQVKWKLEDNHNELLAASRRAELFVKNLGFKVVRDTYTCNSATGVKAPYDLILEGYGSVDVKSTIERLDSKGNTYASFNVQNFTKGVKFAFLVVMDEKREDFKYVFAIPGKLIYGHSTISITVKPTISKKYNNFLIWDFKNNLIINNDGNT